MVRFLLYDQFQTHHASRLCKIICFFYRRWPYLSLVCLVISDEILGAVLRSSKESNQYQQATRWKWGKNNIGINRLPGENEVRITSVSTVCMVKTRQETSLYKKYFPWPNISDLISKWKCLISIFVHSAVLWPGQWLCLHLNTRMVARLVPFNLTLPRFTSYK